MFTNDLFLHKSSRGILLEAPAIRQFKDNMRFVVLGSFVKCALMALEHLSEWSKKASPRRLNNSCRDFSFNQNIGQMIEFLQNNIKFYQPSSPILFL